MFDAVRHFGSLLGVLAFALMLTACGGDKNSSSTPAPSSNLSGRDSAGRSFVNQLESDARQEHSAKQSIDVNKNRTNSTGANSVVATATPATTSKNDLMSSLAPLAVTLGGALVATNLDKVTKGLGTAGKKIKGAATNLRDKNLQRKTAKEKRRQQEEINQEIEALSDEAAKIKSELCQDSKNRAKEIGDVDKVLREAARSRREAI